MTDISKRTVTSTETTNTSRRQLLKTALGVTAGVLVAPQVMAALPQKPERHLELFNLHTGEQLKTTYWVDGQYQAKEIQAINHILRDHRTNELFPIDRKLFDLMALLLMPYGDTHPLEIISGYRSESTNEMLRKTGSGGVAKKSYHTIGKAVDIKLAGTKLIDLYQAAVELKAGGVGYYPKEGFVHIDTGPVRHWQG